LTYNCTLRSELSGWKRTLYTAGYDTEKLLYAGRYEAASYGDLADIYGDVELILN